MESIILWWLIYFTFFGTLAMGICTLKGWKAIPVLVVMLIGSLPFSIIMYYVGLRFYNKKSAKRIEIMEQIVENGPTPELAAEYAKEVEKIKKHKFIEGEYISLADLYLSIQQYEQAASILAKVNPDNMFAYESSTAVRAEIVTYYSVCLDCYLKQEKFEEYRETYQQAKMYFDEFENQYPYNNLIAIARSAYYCLEEKYEKAFIALDTAQLKDEQEKRAFELAIKRAYIHLYSKMGEKQKARKFLEEAMVLTRNEYEKRELELAMQGL